MATADMIRLELPKITITDATPTSTSLECTANQLTLGADLNEDANSFCDPDGLGEAYFELAAGISIDFLNAMLDNAKTYVDAEIIMHREKASPAAENWVFAGKVWVPTLAMVINAAVRGYTRETIRFESRGESWTVDKGAGPVAIPGWR